MQGQASREDAAPKSCCYQSKTVESGGRHGLAKFHGGAAMCCSATGQVDVSKLRPQTFPLTGSSFSFQVVCVNPGFVTHNDT
jgi:hypothetical protein